LIIGKNGETVKLKKMKKLISYLGSDKIYFMVVVLSGAYFTHRGNYTIAFMELVLILLLIKKNRI
jgi:hypothetical protein